MYLSLGPYSSPSRSRVVLPNGGVLSAEVMDTPAKRAAGMQFRNGFPPHTVMLFVHPTPGNFRYHMRNVGLPLDLVSLDQRGGGSYESNRVFLETLDTNPAVTGSTT